MAENNELIYAVSCEPKYGSSLAVGGNHIPSSRNPVSWFESEEAINRRVPFSGGASSSLVTPAERKRLVDINAEILSMFSSINMVIAIGDSTADINIRRNAGLSAPILTQFIRRAVASSLSGSYMHTISFSPGDYVGTLLLENAGREQHPSYTRLALLETDLDTYTPKMDILNKHYPIKYSHSDYNMRIVDAIKRIYPVRDYLCVGPKEVSPDMYKCFPIRAITSKSIHTVGSDVNTVEADAYRMFCEYIIENKKFRDTYATLLSEYNGIIRTVNERHYRANGYYQTGDVIPDVFRTYMPEETFTPASKLDIYVGISKLLRSIERGELTLDRDDVPTRMHIVGTLYGFVIRDSATQRMFVTLATMGSTAKTTGFNYESINSLSPDDGIFYQLATIDVAGKAIFFHRRQGPSQHLFGFHDKIRQLVDMNEAGLDLADKRISRPGSRAFASVKDTW